MDTRTYGPAPEQEGDLHLPEGEGPFGVVVLWHGGSWSAEATREMLTPAAEDLARRGVAAWNVTYRRIGSGGGWPATWDDGRAALAHVAALADEGAPLDLGDVATLGFSAGLPVAHHATRLAVREGGRVVPRRMVDIAGVARLAAVARLDTRESGLRSFLGDPDEVPEAYAGADPSEQLPLGVPALRLQGDADDLVPLLGAQRHVERARAAGDDYELRVIAGAGHFDLHLPGTEGWRVISAWLGARAA